MANIDTALTVVPRRPRVFRMSDGNVVVLYYNGTNWGYKVRASGVWGTRTALTSSPNSQGAAWTQDGDTIYGAVSGSGVSFYVYKLVYNAATDSITQTNTLTGDNVPVLAVYVDTAQARLNVIVQITSAGIYLYSFATSNLAAGIPATAITAGSPPVTGQDDSTWVAVGDGSNTWLLAWATTLGSTAVNVVRMVTGTTTLTSQTVETGVPALAANCTGLNASYDASGITFEANQNNAALRYMARTAVNTYSAWTTAITAAISGTPAVAKKLSGNDLLTLYRRNAGQANGEIYKAQRVSSVWDSVGTLVAGGAATGWTSPSVVPSDINNTSGVFDLVYATGTANPFTLVDDSTVLGTAPAAPSNTVVPVITGTLATGQTLTCSTGTWVGTPTITYAYQWRRGGVDIAGETTSTHVIVEADEGLAITCRVTATNGTGSDSAISNSVAPPDEPSNTVLPTISGTTQTGQVLTGSIGSWANSPSSYAYRWLRDGAAIGGETATTYTLQVADEGHSIRFGVTASNGGGSSSEALSNGVTPTAVPPEPDMFVRVAGAWVPTIQRVRVGGAWRS